MSSTVVSAPSGIRPSRRDLGGEVEAYQEVARRLGLMPEGADTTVLDMETHRKKRDK
jgi:phosphoribosylaminoimidazole-succinocarboxamide synthase